MKIFVLGSLFIMMLGVSCTRQPATDETPAQEKPVREEPQTRRMNVPLNLESDLLQEQYELFAAHEMQKPIQRYLIARDGDTEIEIRQAADVAQITTGIHSTEEALAFVRLLSSYAVRPLLADIYYQEVHQKVPTKEGEAEDRWFALDADQYAAWDVHDPVVTEEEQGYKIERFVACYPQIKDGERTQAQLVKIWEWVTPEGEYRAEIQSVLAEGDEIHKILLFTK